MGSRRADVASANRLVWVAGTIVLVLFIVAFSYAFYGERGSARLAELDPASQTLVAMSEPLQVAEKDTDGDGVSDWEEILWGTDPNSADTDGDGISDSRGDFIDPINQTTDGSTILPGSFSSSTDNATQIVARELLGSYMLEVREANTTLSVEQQNTIVQDTLRVAATQFRPPTVSQSDLSVVPSSREAGVRYITEFYNLLVEFSAGAANDYEIMKALSGNNRSQAVEELVLSVERTVSYVERMKNIPVPEDAAKMHAEFLTAVLGYASSVENIAMIGVDPVRSALGIQMVLVYDQLMRSTIESINRYTSSYNL